MNDVKTEGKVEQSSNVKVGCLSWRAGGPTVKSVLVL